MPASLPTIPGGSSRSTPFSSCWPSLRVRWSRSGLKAPALALSGFSEKPGENGRAAIDFGQSPPPGRLVSVNGEEGEAGGFPDQGFNTVVAVWGPQVGELLSTA